MIIPEYVEHIRLMQQMWGDEYYDAIWHLRNKEQDRRESERRRAAEMIERLRLANVEIKCVENRSNVLQFVRRVVSACLV